MIENHAGLLSRLVNMCAFVSMDVVMCMYVRVCASAVCSNWCISIRKRIQNETSLHRKYTE